ncbi:tape measure protein [Lysinibacillus xylanilyticus]|uniref:tape measure protein n=1 Tax=Lysinibacillus xylanilyticus TaxID=582475 RepID=UPI002E2154B3|nr:tape measure protein [Lysinibacillus xylanilyticus]
MATIRTAIQIQDQLSQPMRAMHNAVSMMVNQMEAMHAASGQMMDTSSVQLAQRELARAAEQFNKIENEVRNAGNAQNGFNNNIRDGTSAADGLLGKIMGIAAAYLSFKSVGDVFKLSDELTNTTARLNLINDGLQTTEQLQQMIYDSAQRSRGAYADTADMVAKLAMNAGEAFKSNAETVAFGELLNKQFVIAGTNIEGIASTTLQLTQAMGSGVLRGEELNAVFEATPNVIRNIAEYLNVSIGQIREMASNGEITADIVKKAMFSAADDINKKFESMPKTWTQLWIGFKNEALWAFQNVLVKLNEIANSDKFKQMMKNSITALNQMADVAIFAMDILAAGGSFVYNNWSLIAPVLWGVTAALGAYGTALLITKVAEIASTIWLGLKTLALGLMTATSWAGVQATMALTAASWGLNTALMSNPIFIIIMAIIILIGIIYIAVAAINHFAGTSISATGIIAGAFMVLGTYIFNIIAYLWNIFAAIAEFFVNVWSHPIYSVKKLFYNLVSNVLDQTIAMSSGWDKFATGFANAMIDAVNLVIEAWNWLIDLLPTDVAAKIGLGKGTEFSHRTSITSDLKGIKAGLNNWVGEAPADYWEAPKMEMKSLGDAWDTGYNWGADLFSSDKNKGKSNSDKAIENAMKNAGDPSGLGDKLDKGNRNGDKTAKNTAKMAKKMDGAGEDLKYLRDIAEREAINRYTTAEINIDMKNENHINSEMDIDGVINQFGKRAEEVAGMLAEGGPTEYV